MGDAKQTAHVPAAGKIVFAHRGLNHQAPENTMPAFQLAADSGVEWIETDVDILKDGTAVILHDSTLDRTTNMSGSMYLFTVEDLPSIDAGAKFGKGYEGTPIPTLDDLIDFLNRNQINANIEIKPHEAGEAGTMKLIDQVITALEKLDPEREVIVSSFSSLTLERFHQKAPQYAIAQLFDRYTLRPEWLSVLEMVGATYIHVEDADPLSDDGLKEEYVRAFLDAGYGVNVWTVNDPKRAQELFDWGVTGVFSDVADELLETSADESPA